MKMEKRKEKLKYFKVNFAGMVWTGLTRMSDKELRKVFKNYKLKKVD